MIQSKRLQVISGIDDLLLPDRDGPDIEDSCTAGLGTTLVLKRIRK